MTEFRLGWFCYILQKSEKKKRNQEDFVNSILNRLVGENNPKISFIPEINRVPVTAYLRVMKKFQNFTAKLYQ